MFPNRFRINKCKVLLRKKWKIWFKIPYKNMKINKKNLMYKFLIEYKIIYIKNHHKVLFWALLISQWQIWASSPMEDLFSIFYEDQVACLFFLSLSLLFYLLEKCYVADKISKPNALFPYCSYSLNSFFLLIRFLQYIEEALLFLTTFESLEMGQSFLFS